MPSATSWHSGERTGGRKQDNMEDEDKDGKDKPIRITQIKITIWLKGNLLNWNSNMFQQRGNQNIGRDTITLEQIPETITLTENCIISWR